MVFMIDHLIYMMDDLPKAKLNDIFNPLHPLPLNKKSYASKLDSVHVYVATAVPILLL